MIGNLIYLVGGTGPLAAVRRQISAVTNTNTITVDATVATGTGITGNVGGCLASPGEVGRNLVSGNEVYIQAGTYSISSNSTNISGGKLSYAAGGASNYTRVYGYQTTRSDWRTGGTKPVLDLAVAGVTTVVALNARSSIYNIEIHLNSTATASGITASGGSGDSVAFACKVTGGGSASTGILFSQTRGAMLSCEVTGCAGSSGITAGSGNIVIGCNSHGNTCRGFDTSSTGATFNFCLAYANTGATVDGFVDTVGATYCNCTSYGNGRAGFNLPTAAFSSYANCVATGNTGEGFYLSSQTEMNVLIGCAGFGNSQNYNTSNIAAEQVFAFIALTADPFVDASTGNFTLTAGGTAALGATGFPQTYPGSTTGVTPTIGGGKAATARRGGFRIY